MHKPSLLSTLLLLGVLVAYYFLQPVSEVTTYSQLAQLPENTPVHTAGIVIKQTTAQQTSYLLLNTNITLIFKGTKPYLNHTVKATGTVDTFRFPRIQVTEIRTVQQVK